MYNFKSELEEQRFNKSLNDCIEPFRNENSERKRKKAVDCNLNIFRLAQLNHRRGTDDFYKNLTYELQLVYDYLHYLNDNKLYQFEEWELDIFRK